MSDRHPTTADGISTATGSPRSRGGQVDKRQAIMAGALQVFGRDGYTRAGIDAIAKAAGVSTRTIYNHFTDKAELFATVIEESASEVAGTQIAYCDRYLGRIVDLEEDLVALGLALATPSGRFVAHFTLVGHIQAEIAHLPDDVVEAWSAAGPRRFRVAFANAVDALIERGVLVSHGEDPLTVAEHYLLLATGVVTSRTYRGVIEMPRADLEREVRVGVRAFLRAYGPPARPAR